MSERDKILGRVREALRVPAHKHTQPHASTSATPSSGARQWLPFVGPSFEERLALFRKNAAELKAEFQLFRSRDELLEGLTRLRDLEQWKKIGTHAGALTDLASAALSLPVCRTDRPFEAGDLESCDVGISECDALVAQTGSVLVTSRSAGGRALSVLPPHHVVLARQDQVIPDLPGAFDLIKERYSANYPSFISFITGPSRTGDIERILVLGAHGPRKLTIFCF